MFNKKDKLQLFCDIDGTVNYHYKRIRKWSLPTWPGNSIDPHAFTREEILKDEVLPSSIEAINKLSKYYNIHFLSARNFQDAFTITKEWLDNNSFNYQSINIVSKPDEKIKILKENNCEVFIDDLQRGHHTDKIEYYYEIIDELIKNNINFEIFSNNWSALTAKYIQWAKKNI